mmetsp:Transcript_34990/g.74656  ORF Transcript_34990/g.74656 Transcript_34990/m.74656 type:complete len:219 (-) Transcript_34990:1313-1969(-)
MQQSFPTDTICRPSGLQPACVTSSECASPVAMGADERPARSQTCSSPDAPATSKYSPPGESAMWLSRFSLPSISSCSVQVTSMLTGSSTSQSHVLIEPVESHVKSSRSCVPSCTMCRSWPSFTLCVVTRRSCLRFTVMTALSSPHEWMSSGLSASRSTVLTAPRCSENCATSCREFKFQIRSAPSRPPDSTYLGDSAIEVTPPRCALHTSHTGEPVSV